MQLLYQYIPSINPLLELVGSSSSAAQQQQQHPTSTAPDVQPDDVRSQSAPVTKTDPSMRCFESLPPWSMLTTNGVEIYVESHFVTGPDPGEEVKAPRNDDFSIEK